MEKKTAALKAISRNPIRLNKAVVSSLFTFRANGPQRWLIHFPRLGGELSHVFPTWEESVKLICHTPPRLTVYLRDTHHDPPNTLAPTATDVLHKWLSRKGRTLWERACIYSLHPREASSKPWTASLAPTCRRTCLWWAEIGRCFCWIYSPERAQEGREQDKALNKALCRLSFCGFLRLVGSFGFSQFSIQTHCGAASKQSQNQTKPGWTEGSDIKTEALMGFSLLEVISLHGSMSSNMLRLKLQESLLTGVRDEQSTALIIHSGMITVNQKVWY